MRTEHNFQNMESIQVFKKKSLFIILYAITMCAAAVAR